MVRQRQNEAGVEGAGAVPGEVDQDEVAALAGLTQPFDGFEDAASGEQHRDGLGSKTAVLHQGVAQHRHVVRRSLQIRHQVIGVITDADQQGALGGLSGLGHYDAEYQQNQCQPAPPRAGRRHAFSLLAAQSVTSNTTLPAA